MTAVGEGTSGETIAFEGVPFTIDPTRADDPAWFVLGIRKSGSSMFNRAVKLMAKYNDITWVDIPGDLFDNNVPVPQWRDKPVPPGLLRGGNVYGGFRDCPNGMIENPVFRDAIKVLLVRDPRDAIVSEYFSTAYTHSIPAGTGTDGAREVMLRRREEAQRITVEDFAREQAIRMANTIERYIPLIRDPKILILKYEDVVFEKRRMVNKVTRHFGWKIEPSQIDQIVKWIDVVPTEENPAAFIRKVTPGDHREKLSPEVIAAIDVVLAPAMQAFGYM